MNAALAAGLLSLSTNLDNLAIATTLGLGGTLIPWTANLTIATLSGLSTWMAILMGASLAPYLPDGTSDGLGGLLLLAIGLWTCRTREDQSALGADTSTDSAHDRERKKIAADDRDSLPDTLSLLQAWGLGFALTATNFCTGVSAGLASVPVELASLLSFATSLVTIGLGAYCGRRLAARFAERWLDRGAGLLLAGLGACEIFAL